MGRHYEHRALATSLGVTVADLNHVRSVLAEVERAVLTEPRACRHALVARRLHVTPDELTRLHLALRRGCNGTTERAVVKRLARLSLA